MSTPDTRPGACDDPEQRAGSGTNVPQLQQDVWDVAVHARDFPINQSVLGGGVRPEKVRALADEMFSVVHRLYAYASELQASGNEG